VSGIPGANRGARHCATVATGALSPCAPVLALTEVLPPQPLSPSPPPALLCRAAIAQQVRTYTRPDATPLLPPTDEGLLFGPLPGVPGGVGANGKPTATDELELARLRWALDGDPRSPYPMAAPRTTAEAAAPLAAPAAVEAAK